ncbi:Uncharacterized conserved protein YbjT, contains NAD(P)-binding and DUF2867 domains [Tessaracoccus bendigoensis DSM 12906]|uniref:Uncharacterized conserved protein YbjT, contains NAD(P)-binding and DUF2867 domains n=1 Tax=Tessaracoccus bendigoensis DSM 12906 TaxID=1123357 RepID=A0A1M6C9H4_9ACTN|nr:SDR family oxidoreductase [Tessaracoccus bendigoensis]SHI57414.1 Uncharacterized conserved protein YbjT, contains NAD(P)-binding and DUF2867 domains [Tessaracoccus bendigoensis DSM 12906]
MSVTTVLVVGATGSIGREVVAAATAAGLTARALVRDVERAGRVLPADTDFVVGDLTRADTLTDAVHDIDAVIFTHGSETGDWERVDYGGVKNILAALGTRRPRIALMTSIYVTRLGEGHDEVIGWKRRNEWLVRSSGADYTIVRPSWFDHAAATDNRIVFEQGDTGDGGIRRDQLARVLVEAILTDTAIGKTLEVFAQPGEGPGDWSALFGALDPDTGLDGAHDATRVPLEDEPAQIQLDMAAVGARGN